MDMSGFEGTIRCAGRPKGDSTGWDGCGPMPEATEDKKAWLLGLGFDNKDGHVRLTRGDNFRLVGGSEETHSTMQEKALRFNEKLRERGRRLEDISREEFRDIAHDIGLTDKNLLP